MEVVTAVVIGMMVATGISMGLQAALSSRTNVDHSNESIVHARETIDFLEALIRRATLADSTTIVNMRGTDTFRGICFFADLDDDPNRELEWVWVWRDELRQLNGDFPPFWRRHSVKVAAFRRSPPPGQENFDTGEGELLYNMINSDPRCHLVIASHASQFQLLVDPAGVNPAVRVDAGFFINNALQSTFDVGPTWNEVSPGSTAFDVPPPSVTLTRFIKPRAINTTASFSTRSPVDPNGGFLLRRPIPPTTNQVTLRNSEVNYIAAITNNPRHPQGPWMLRPR